MKPGRTLENTAGNALLAVVSGLVALIDAIQPARCRRRGCGDPPSLHEGYTKGPACRRPGCSCRRLTRFPLR